MDPPATIDLPGPPALEGLRALLEAARAADRPLALLCLRLDRLERLDQAAAREALQDGLGRLLEGADPDGAWALAREDERWWLACPDLDAAQAAALGRTLVERVRALRVEARGRRLRATLSAGLAHGAHRSRPALETCLSTAEEGLRVATAAGGDRAVHSEVYASFSARGAAGHAERRGLLLVRAPRRLREIELPRPEPAAAAAPARPEPAADEPAELKRAEGELVRWLREYVEAQHAAADDEHAQRSDEEVVLLRRRLTKLLAALEHAEGEIARLRGRLGAEPTGLSSIYREVQGLSDDDAFGEIKRAMMARLYAENVALRERVLRGA